MSDITTSLAFASGGAIIRTFIGIVVTYPAMKKQFRLREVSVMTMPVVYIWIILMILSVFGLDGNDASPAGVLTTLLVPIMVSALVFYTTFRVPSDQAKIEGVDKRIKRRNEALAKNEKLTAMMTAAGLGDLERVRELIELGTDPNETSVSGHTALMYAARNDHRDIADYLLSKEADRRAQTKAGSTASDIAKRFGHTELSAHLA